MPAHHLSLRFLCLLVIGVIADPAPGRIPKVYNALITSNQNLEPSKAYPVYQPVLHDAFGFPFQPALFYGGDFPLSNGVLPPIPASPPKEGDATPAPPPASTPEAPKEEQPSTENPPPAPSSPEPINPEPAADGPTEAPLTPPSTESPIPLNEFGLPPQVLPLGRLDPAYNGFSQLGPFTYTYPGLRFYDPYDPFSFSPYVNYSPLYRPLTNVLGQTSPVLAGKDLSPAPAPAPSPDQSAQSPPPEPNDLNILNYSSKDPAIPNVPPPPLPQGGLKTENSE